MRERMNSVLLLVMFLAITPLARIAAADGPLVQVSGSSPFGVGCAGPQPGYNFHDSEVEPWLAVNPANPNHLVGTWQQDRWDDGGAQGLVAGVSFDGGLTWLRVPIPRITICSGGADYGRASDPWVSFAPNGVVYHTSLAVSHVDFVTAILVSRSTDGGLTWGTPIELIRDTALDVFNDKEAVTADPTNANYAYVVWDRLKVPPAERTAGRSFEHATSYLGPTWFSRTTNGGVSWEPARAIFDPGVHRGTIANQMVVLPSGELILLMDLYHDHDNSKKERGLNAAVLRSTDKGLTWSDPIMIDRMLVRGGVEPTSGWWVRGGELSPEIAVDPSSGHLYVVWEDARFSGYDQVAFSMSTDGGLTWSSPIRINRSPAGVRAFTPAVSVNANGTVGVTYYDFRNNSALGGAVPGGTDQFLVTCDGGCTNPANWHEKRVTPASFDLRNAPWAGGLFVGDYEGLATAGLDFLTFFAMPHPGDRASVFFRRMTPPAAAAIAADGSATPGVTMAERSQGIETPEARTFAIEGVQPNPAVGGRLTLRMALPNSEPARLELLDVTGRRVAMRDLASLGAGSHTVDVTAGRRIPAGLYIVRLTQGERVATTRAVVLE
jgi:hypothetical protein